MHGRKNIKLRWALLYLRISKARKLGKTKTLVHQTKPKFE